MKKAFATNLRKVRQIHGWNQLQAAQQVGKKRSTYQSYEEGRACPSAEDLVDMADAFGVDNLKAFISDPGFDFHNQDAAPRIANDSPLQANYAKASQRDKNIVDLILGIGMK